jgi:serine/threonine protein phosphatase PrpC
MIGFGLGIHATAYGRSDRGRVRPNNEDAFVIGNASTRQIAEERRVTGLEVGPRGLLLAVSDGMGGAAAGEVASAITLASLWKALGAGVARDPGVVLEEAVLEAHRDVREAARAPERDGMGATLVAAFVSGGVAHVVCVGDSRAYVVREGRIEQLTRDQTYAEMFVDAGVLSREQATRSAYRHQLLQAVGCDEELQVARWRLELRRGDVLLLCSDGLTSRIEDRELLHGVCRSESLAEACEWAIELANARGGRDNATIVLAELDGGGLALPRTGETIAETIAVVRPIDFRRLLEPLSAGQTARSRWRGLRLNAARAAAAVVALAHIFTDYLPF